MQFSELFVILMNDVLMYEYDFVLYDCAFFWQVIKMTSICLQSHLNPERYNCSHPNRHPPSRK